MTEASVPRIARVRRLLDAARMLADPRTALGARARAELPAVSGLSAENVALALSEVLEVDATDGDLQRLLATVEDSPRTHVLLAANVFTAPLRAIALALAQSPRVDVRPSRREPLFTELLHEASHGAFRIVSELAPAPGDHVWAYGSDETLESVRGELPAGVVFHGHGSGFGVAVLELDDADAAQVTQLSAALARDVVVFDQRGCLSPRLVLVVGAEARARQFATELAAALARHHHDIPPGPLSSEEAALVSWYRDTFTYAAEAFPAGKGVVGFSPGGELTLPPVGRNVHVARLPDPVAPLEPWARAVTSVGLFGSEQLRVRLAGVVAGARLCAVGQQQRPPLDGPVDLRERTRREVL